MYEYSVKLDHANFRIGIPRFICLRLHKICSLDELLRFAMSSTFCDFVTWSSLLKHAIAENTTISACTRFIPSTMHMYAHMKF